jgi:hypothetical protein
MAPDAHQPSSVNLAASSIQREWFGKSADRWTKPSAARSPSRPNEAQRDKRRMEGKEDLGGARYRCDGPILIHPEAAKPQPAFTRAIKIAALNY